MPILSMMSPTVSPYGGALTQFLQYAVVRGRHKFGARPAELGPMSPTSSSSVASSDQDEEEDEEVWSVPPLGGEVAKRSREDDEEPDPTSVQARRARKHVRTHAA
jgi:hypothetical protein